MRFGAPRSLSPSPVRRVSRSHREPRKSSGYGLHSDSEDDSSDASSDAGSSASSSSSSSASVFKAPISPPKRKHVHRSHLEQRYVEDTVAAIRLRTRHRDPYEEWEKETRRDAFRTARREQTTIRSQRRDEMEKARAADAARLALLHTNQMMEVEKALGALRVKQQGEEDLLKEQWKKRDEKLWERIDKAIKYEQDKADAKAEAERKRQEEALKKQRDAETKRRLEEEKRRHEEEKAKKEEEERKQKEAEAEKLKTERTQAEEEGRRALGLTTATEDWTHARTVLKNLKSGPMKNVKANKELKTMWNWLRRQITPKIGQLTNDPQEIARISREICDLFGQAPNEEVYYAGLSSLAKAILLQAETEVTAEPRSAIPLAGVTTNLITGLDGFADIFFAKLVQRSGGWPVPVVVPETDVDGAPWTDEEQRIKALGYRRGSEGDRESASEYSARVGGMMRVYFHVLRTPVDKPLHRLFQTPRVWGFFARMTGEKALLDSPVAPVVLHAGLDVYGTEAVAIWGQQWIKILALLYRGVTVGLGDDNRFIGGQSPEGRAARVRVQLAIERAMSS